MTTQARILANRLNAQKSTGPKTQKGKEIVAQNALKHGLSARHDVVITEDQADFDLHRDALLAELAPQGPMESILADRIISLSWRLKRADRIQNQTFDAMDEDNKSNPFPNLTKALVQKALNRPNPQTSDPQHDLTLGRIAIKDFANARVLDRILMYERRIENSLHKTILELQRLTLIRNLDPPEPKPVGATPCGRPNPTHSPPTPTFNRRRHGDAETTDHPQSPTESPKPQQILPILPPNQPPSTQNKPNPKNQKNNTTPATANNYNQEPLRREKTNPNKPNPGAGRNTTYHIRHPKYDPGSKMDKHTKSGYDEPCAHIRILKQY